MGAVSIFEAKKINQKSEKKENKLSMQLSLLRHQTAASG